MIEKLREFRNTKTFHIVMLIIIIIVILFVLGMIGLKYNVEGETNMPFRISKVALISSSEGKDKESKEHKWAFDINQNNDIYIYVEKNSNFNEKEVIDTIIIENFKIERAKELGEAKIYKPNSLDVGGAFYNVKENETNKLEYKGALNTNFSTMNIGNQGGILAFRFANDKLSEYISDEPEINHSLLLKQANIKEEDLHTKLSFDLMIKTGNGNQFKTHFNYELPIEGIIEKGTTFNEITDTSNIIFKRVKK